jgi:hypothetical protein
MAGRGADRGRQFLVTVCGSALALALALGGCGYAATPVAGMGPISAATPRTDSAVDLVPKNLTATAYRPSANPITPQPPPGGTSGTVWVTHGGPIVDHVSFLDKLRGARCTVEFTDAVRQPFLRGQPIGLRVSGCGLARPAELQSFWYHSDDLGTDGLRAAEEDARGIRRDRLPIAAAVAWAAPPHFFRKGRAFVLYLGDDPAMLGLLTTLLGPQFAGSER